MIDEKGNNIDLVLMDIKMPNMDGYEATRIIKSKSKIPVIAQTSYAMSGEKELSFKAGCDDYLSKPLEKWLLLDTINRYIDGD
jgi:CheY-like chemotaxis protein